MRFKCVVIFLGVLLSMISSVSNAGCGATVPQSAKHRGNFLCASCLQFDTSFDGNSIPFIKETVNATVGRWKPNDQVTITNGKSWATFQYMANGNFVITGTGGGKGKGVKDDIGPGTAVNHDGKGAACKKDETTSSGSGGPNTNVGNGFPVDLGPGATIPMPPTRIGYVTVEECERMPAGMAQCNWYHDPH